MDLASGDRGAGPPSTEPFGSNEVRLSARQWAVAIGLVLLVVALTPPLWERLEHFETGPDYRIPYSLSKDYWLYQRLLRKAGGQEAVFVVGDSVVWGEYVLPDGTLSHFLSDPAGQPHKFVNAGVNGLFPLALEGLVRHYAPALRGRKVLLHCNLLWMSSSAADLSTAKERKFNHARLVPQFVPWIPSYRADLSERLSAVAERNLEFFAWVNHLNNTGFGGRALQAWTLADDGGAPPNYTNAYRNPLQAIDLNIPSPAEDDPLRGPESPRHKAWSETGRTTGHFEWVRLETSLQWGAFRRLSELLIARGNDLLVVVGPFNEHFLAEENLPAFQATRKAAAAWFQEMNIPHLLPKPLPSSLYADASHPLTEGYRLMAERLLEDELFQQWLEGRSPRPPPSSH